MSAVVCGKRSFFEEIPASPTSASPPAAKKIRCFSAISPVMFSISPPPAALIFQLTAQFPHMDSQLLVKALEECSNNMDAAIKKLNEMQLAYTQDKSSTDFVANATMENGIRKTDGVAVYSEDPTLLNNLPVDGPGWVELFVSEMTRATSVDDARARASRVLESLEKSISVHASAETTSNIQKENMMLKEQIEELLRDNAILKRAVAIQHEHQKERDERNQEVQILKQMVTQFQEKLRTLEVDNYALTLHLQHAQQSNSIPGHCHPDIF